MLALLSGRTEEIQRFRASPWSFQQTFQTPLKDLNRFVSTFLAPFTLERGTLSTDEVVFEPKDILHLLSVHSLSVENYYHMTIEATGQRSIGELLQAALGDWVDFLFVPSPEILAIYADHDEYTTFYAPDAAALRTVTSRLETVGFKSVLDYTRQSSGDRWR